MFERFTDRARRVLVLAQEEARLLNHNFIGTEHLLLGLIHEGEGVAAQALQAMGISLEAVRARVEETIGSPGSGTQTGSPPFTPRAKKVLELSLREALQLGHNYIGTEHILLGLVREGEGVAAQVLVSLGADLPRVRRHVMDLLEGYQPPGSQARPPGAPAGGLRSGRPGRRTASVRPARPRLGDRPPGLSSVVSGAVELTHGDDRLTGTVAGEVVDMALVVGARAEGAFAATAVSARWTLAPNQAWHPDVPASLRGTFGAAPVDLRGWFHLDPDFRFDHGAVEGEFSGQPVAASIDAGEAGSFAAHGYFADAGFSLRAGFDGQAKLEGSVEGAPVHLEVTVVEGGTRTRTLAGSYDGPSPLLLLLSGVLLFFT
jgi:hypothetical protein